MIFLNIIGRRKQAGFCSKCTDYKPKNDKFIRFFETFRVKQTPQGNMQMIPLSNTPSKNNFMACLIIEYFINAVIYETFFLNSKIVTNNSNYELE